MSLQHQALHAGRLLHIGCVQCCPEHAGCSAVEYAGVHTVAFPLRGVFVKHHDDGTEVIAHAGQAISSTQASPIV